MDKIRFKRGIVEALHTVVAKTKYLPTLMEYPEMIAKLDRFTESFIHESNEMPKNLTLLLNDSKNKLKQMNQGKRSVVHRIYDHITYRPSTSIQFDNNLRAFIIIWILVCFAFIFFVKFFTKSKPHGPLLIKNIEI